MSKQTPMLPDPDNKLPILSELIKQLRLVWLLFWDGQVPLWVKTVLPASLLYLFSPVDFIPDVILGLGQLDDIGVILLGMALFVRLCPQDIVQNYLDQLEYGDLSNNDEIVDTTYRIMDED